MTGELALNPREVSGSGYADADLVERCLASDEEAWAALIGRYADYVYAVAIRGFRLSPEDAEEVLQDTMLQVYEHLADYRGTGALRAWIGSIAQNACRQRLRARSRRDESALPADVPDDTQQRALDSVEEAFQTRSALRSWTRRAARSSSSSSFTIASMRKSPRIWASPREPWPAGSRGA